MAAGDTVLIGFHSGDGFPESSAVLKRLQDPTIHKEGVALKLDGLKEDGKRLAAEVKVTGSGHLIVTAVNGASVEEMKGGEEIREAAELLRAADLPQLEFIGFVEGDGLGAGAADVIVTEGFTGNIALKAAEGTAKQIAEYLRSAMARSWRSRIGYLFARNAFKSLRDKMDPSKSNGGVLLGLKGIVVKSHGGTDAEGFAYAVDVGYDMVRYDLLAKINQMLNRDGSTLSPAPAAQEAVS